MRVFMRACVVVHSCVCATHEVEQSAVIEHKLHVGGELLMGRVCVRLQILVNCTKVHRMLDDFEVLRNILAGGWAVRKAVHTESMS